MPDPANYDDESSWMSVCVPAVMDEGKPNDQAVAQCIGMWRDRNKEELAAIVEQGRQTLGELRSLRKPLVMGSAKNLGDAVQVAPKALVFRVHPDAIGSAVSDRVQKSYGMMHRAYSRLEVKGVDEERRIIKGIASTPSVDRVGDIVDPMGAKFDIPMGLMLDHQHTEQVGHVHFAKPTKNGIPFEASIVRFDEPGEVKNLVDKAWHLVKTKLRSFVSIGFKPLPGGVEAIENGGLKFNKWEWIELSLVSVPAQKEAVILEAKSLDAAMHEIRSLDADQLAASGKELAGLGNGAAKDAAPSRPGAAGKSKTVTLKRKEREMSTYTEQIQNVENTRASKAARMAAIMKGAMDEGRATDDAEQQEFDDLHTDVDRLDKDLQRLRVVERTMVQEAKPVSSGEIKTVEDASNARSGHISVKGPSLPPGIAFARVVKCIGIARGNLNGATIVAEKNYPDDPRIGNILKAAIAAGSTTNQPWAGALVSPEGAVFAEFLEFLRPLTILGKFGRGGIPSLRNIPFRVPIGSQTSGGSAAWVGEGTSKPLTYFEVARTSLEPLKCAAIVVVTEELLKYASMPAEQWLRDQLVAALRERLDLDFIDPASTSIPGVRPASITNGVTTVTSAGSSADAVRSDIAAVTTNFIAANNLATQSVWIMDATTALRLSMMTTDLGQQHSFNSGLTMAGGTFAGIPVIVSEYVGEFAGSPGAANVWLVAADQIFLGDEGGFNVDLSREASLLMDNAPAMSSGGVGSPDAPVGAQLVSMYQTNSVALRAERTVSWVKARASAVQGISNVQWGTS